MPIDGVFVNEPLLLSLLETQDDCTGKAAWLLGCFQYSVGLKKEALHRWLTAWEQGFRHTALLYSLGQMYLLEGNPDKAREFLLEDASLHGSANAESLALLFRLLRESGDVCLRLENLAKLEGTANRAVVIGEIIETLRDSGRPEDALALLETSHFQNWEGAETAGLLWSSVVGMIALELARKNAAAARNMAARMFKYPKGLNYGRRPQQSQARYWHMLGTIYRLTGDQKESREAFRSGALEGGAPAIRDDTAAMLWVRRCQNELCN